MNLLEILYQDIFADLLCKWVGSAKDLTRLDSALNNNLLRARYLKCLQETPCGISAPITINFLRKLKEFQVWCQLRQLKIQTLTINKLSVVGDQALLCSFKRLTSLTFHGPSYLCYKILFSVIAQLRDLKTLKFQSITCLVDLSTLSAIALDADQEPILSNISELHFSRVHLLTSYYASIEDVFKYELFYASLLNSCPKLNKLATDDCTGLSYKVINRLLHSRNVLPELEIFSYYVKSYQELAGKPSNAPSTVVPLTTLKASTSTNSKLHTVKLGISDDYDDPSHLLDVYSHLYTTFSAPNHFSKTSFNTMLSSSTTGAAAGASSTHIPSFHSNGTTLSYSANTTIRHVDLDVDDLTSSHRDLLVCTVIPYTWQSLLTCRLVAIRSHLDPIIMTLAMVCTRLERLELSHCLHVSEESFRMLTTGRLFALKSLILYALCGMQDFDMEAFCLVDELETNSEVEIISDCKAALLPPCRKRKRALTDETDGDMSVFEQDLKLPECDQSEQRWSDSTTRTYLYHHLQECIVHHCTKLTGTSFYHLLTTFTRVMHWNVEIRLTVQDLLPASPSSSPSSSLLAKIVATVFHPCNAHMETLHLLVSCYLPSSSSSSSAAANNLTLSKSLFDLYAKIQVPFPKLKMMSLVLPYPPLPTVSVATNTNQLITHNIFTNTATITAPVTPASTAHPVVNAFEQDEALNAILLHNPANTTTTSTAAEDVDDTLTVHTDEDSVREEEASVEELKPSQTTATAAAAAEEVQHTLTTCYDMLFTSLLTQQSNEYNPLLSSFALSLGYSSTFFTTSTHHHHYYRYENPTPHAHHSRKVTTSSTYISKHYDGVELVRSLRTSPSIPSPTNSHNHSHSHSHSKGSCAGSVSTSSSSTGSPLSFV